MGILHRKVPGTLAVTILFVASTALATPRDHDSGFFLRLSTGAGGAKTELEDDGGSIKLDGASGDANIAIGGIVTPNLAVHGTLYGWVIQDPNATVTGLGSGTLGGVDLDLSAVGVGMTWYIMPANLYLSPTVGIGRLGISGLGASGNSDAGFVMDLSVGKEWFVSDRWGLGLAGGFDFHSVPDGESGENWSGASFALRFSATLN